MRRFLTSRQTEDLGSSEQLQETLELPWMGGGGRSRRQVSLYQVDFESDPIEQGELLDEQL